MEIWDGRDKTCEVAQGWDCQGRVADSYLFIVLLSVFFRSFGSMLVLVHFGRESIRISFCRLIFCLHGMLVWGLGKIGQD